MMRINSSLLCTTLIAALIITGCSNAGGPERPQPAAARPSMPQAELKPQRPSGLPAPRQLPDQAGAVSPNATLGGGQAPHRPDAPGAPPAERPIPRAALPTGTTHPTTIAGGAPIDQYDAAQMIESFASMYLGLNVHVSHAAGTNGNVAIPTTAQADVDEAVELAGQAAAGEISLGSARGAAQVAIGSGSVSGDIDADISGASEGAFSLLMRSLPPNSTDTALALIRATYPALAAVALEPQSSSQAGFVFYATTTHQGVDWKTHEVTTVAEAVLAGTTKQGRATVVWAVVGNGTFATSVKP
jgi:hypothetical protein